MRMRLEIAPNPMIQNGRRDLYGAGDSRKIGAALPDCARAPAFPRETSRGFWVGALAGFRWLVLAVAGVRLCHGCGSDGDESAVESGPAGAPPGAGSRAPDPDVTSSCEVWGGVTP
ncbi:uncharacterized protein ACDP82_020317 isoform 2-T2 [Pangshura tecta]